MRALRHCIQGDALWLVVRSRRRRVPIPILCSAALVDGSVRMGERADDLARRIEATTDAVIAAVESGQCVDHEARMLAHHLATSHALVLSLAQGIINAEPF